VWRLPGSRLVSAQAATGDSAPESLGRFGAWQGVGPLGGDVRSLVVEPKDKTTYFGTLDGQIYIRATPEKAGGFS
jgi:hypothetical protein